MGEHDPDVRPVGSDRLAPGIPFPPYSYVSGIWPHPLRDPRGHSYGRPAVVPPPVDPLRWRESPDYCYAVDLFNAGFYWESHETWEGLWLASSRRGPLADAIKGLIKLAAAGVKLREDRREGVRRHALRAAELCQYASAQLPAGALGLDFDQLRSLALQLYADASSLATGDGALLPCQLMPQDAA